MAGENRPVYRLISAGGCGGYGMRAAIRRHLQSCFAQRIRRYLFMKKVISLLTAAVMCLALASCGGGGDDGAFSILTSFDPMYALTLRITDGAKNIRVQNMAEPSSGCLHDYQLTTADMTKLSQADLFIINGGGMESFMEKAVEANGSLEVLDTSDGAKMLPSAGHDHENDGDGHEEEYNAHIWLSISNAKVQAKNICEKLALLDPQNSELYERNMADFAGELDALSEEYDAALDGVNGRVISFHEGLVYLFEDYGIEVTEIIESEPGVSPDPRTLSGIIEDVKESGTSVIFTEPQYPASTAEVIARETGAEIYSVDPLVTGEMNRDSYVTVMRENLEIIKTAMTTK